MICSACHGVAVGSRPVPVVVAEFFDAKHITDGAADLGSGVAKADRQLPIIGLRVSLEQSNPVAARRDGTVVTVAGIIFGNRAQVILWQVPD